MVGTPAKDVAVEAVQLVGVAFLGIALSCLVVDDLNRMPKSVES